MSVANTSAAAAGSLPSSKPKSKIEISSCGLQVFRSQVSFNCSCQATAKLTYLTQHMYHVISISCNSVLRLSMWRAASNAAATIFSLMSASRKGKAGKSDCKKKGLQKLRQRVDCLSAFQDDLQFDLQIRELSWNLCIFLTFVSRIISNFAVPLVRASGGLAERRGVCSDALGRFFKAWRFATQWSRPQVSQSSHHWVFRPNSPPLIGP